MKEHKKIILDILEVTDSGFAKVLLLNNNIKQLSLLLNNNKRTGWMANAL